MTGAGPVVRGELRICRILELLKERRPNGKYVACSGVKLAHAMGLRGVQNGIAEAIEDFWDEVEDALKVQGIVCGRKAVIQSGGLAIGWRRGLWPETLAIPRLCRWREGLRDTIAGRRSANRHKGTWSAGTVCPCRKRLAHFPSSCASWIHRPHPVYRCAGRAAVCTPKKVSTSCCHFESVKSVRSLLNAGAFANWSWVLSSVSQ